MLFQFSREIATHLNFTDEQLAIDQRELRVHNHPFSARSHAPNGQPARIFPIHVGDLIFVKGDGDKHNARTKYIVTAVRGDTLLANRLVGSQFRAKQYELKLSEVYPVPGAFIGPNWYRRRENDTSDTDTSLDDDDGSVYDAADDMNHIVNVAPEDMLPADIIPALVPAGGQPDTSDSSAHTSDEDDPNVPTLQPAATSHRPQRQPKPPSYLQDYVTT